jgi:hypothetical protein
MGHGQVIPANRMDADGEAATADPDTAMDASRHLCTGVYIDRAFRNKVISNVYNDAAHRTAPSYGFDLIAVTHAARRAWVLEVIQQVCLLAALVIVLVLDPAAALVAACVLGVAYLAWIGLRISPGLVQLQARTMKEQFLRQRGTVVDHDNRRERSRRVLLCCAGGAILTVVAAVAAVHSDAPSSHITMAAVLLAVLAGISASVGAVRQITLNRIRRLGCPRPVAPRGRLGVIDAQQAGPYVVYRKQSANNGGSRGRTLTRGTNSGLSSAAGRWYTNGCPR